MSKSQMERYRELVGDAAAERQKQAKQEQHACCWEPLTGQHHPACPNRPRDQEDVPPLIEGQEALL